MVNGGLDDGYHAAVDRFLNRPHLMLDDRKPIELIVDQAGADRVINLLGRVAYVGQV